MTGKKRVPVERQQFTPEQLKRWSEVVDIHTLRPHPQNPNIGDEDKIGRSIQAHGLFQMQLISKDDYLLAGNHTYAAAMAKNKPTLAVIRLPLNHDHPQALEIMVAANEAARGSEVDDALQAAILVAVKEELGDFEGSLVEEDWLEKAKREEKKQGKTDIDDAPAAPRQPVTKPGDVWQLGDHLVVCCDSTNAQDIATIFGHKRADMVFTDPPYNADYTGRDDLKRKRARMGKAKGIKNDDMGRNSWRIMIDGALGNANQFLHPGGSAYVCCDWNGYPETRLSFRRYWEQKSLLVWDKRHFGLGQHYRTQYELILFGWKGEKPSHWHAGQRERDVWSIDREDVREYRHPTQKPVELVERALNNSSNRDHLIYDPFGGSGTTLMACERSGRICYTIELDPAYCDVICMRWQSYTDDKPILLTTGEAHDFAA